MTPDDENDPKPEPEIIEASENTDLTLRDVTPEGKRQKIRRWVRKLAIALAIIGPLIFILAALGYRTGIFDLRTSLGVLSQNVGPKVLMLGLGISLISVLLSWFVRPRKGLIISLLAFLVSLGGLINLVGVKSTVEKLPFIHDITTDPEDPPKFTKTIIDARTKTEATNTLEYFEKKDKEDGTLVSVLQSKHYPEIRPVRRSEKPDEVFGQAEDMIKSMGWKVVTVDKENRVLEATDTSFWYGFKDDVIIRIRPSKNGGSLIDMRSVSRVGGSDLGANAERLQKLIDGLTE